jgi:hypothetical protein
MTRFAAQEPLSIESLEERTVLAGDPISYGTGVYYDPALRLLSIVGSESDDRFTLAARPDGAREIEVTYQGAALTPRDAESGLPCSQTGVCPTAENVDSVAVVLMGGNDRFKLQSERLPAVAIFGGSGDDAVSVFTPAQALPIRHDVMFEGGEGLGDAIQIVGTDAREEHGSSVRL